MCVCDCSSVRVCVRLYLFQETKSNKKKRHNGESISGVEVTTAVFPRRAAYSAPPLQALLPTLVVPPTPLQPQNKQLCLYQGQGVQACHSSVLVSLLSGIPEVISILIAPPPSTVHPQHEGPLSVKALCLPQPHNLLLLALRQIGQKKKQ